MSKTSGQQDAVQGNPALGKTFHRKLESISGVSLSMNRPAAEAELRQLLGGCLAAMTTAVKGGANANEDVYALRREARTLEQALRELCPKSQPFKHGYNMRKVSIGWMLSYLVFDEYNDSRELRHVHLWNRDGWWLAKNRSADILLKSRSFLECCRMITRNVQ